jgi:alpha-amylase
MYLLFGVHNHQPVGNFESVFKKATENCYRPFVNTLYNYPQIKFTFHFSGSLIDWLLKNSPRLLEKVKKMVKRGQVEILTGGYYEPILTVIPERDRLGQIKMLSAFIKDYFEYEPKGMWLGERVWGPQLVKSLVEAGVEYILLDEFHFLNGGVKQERLRGYYITEEEGRSLAVFPISKRLRYTIPFSLPAQVIKYLKGLDNAEPRRAVTIVDDGEKFGLWPGTHKWVYHKKWLEKFFKLLVKNEAWLKTEKISEYMRGYKPAGQSHLPAGSYEEMMSWSGGAFKNFFSKYSEADNLYKRMLYVSERLSREENEEARRYLYMGECNCPYWHGVFGGIYLAHLRHIAYKNLITAESLLEKKEEFSRTEIEPWDFDKGGANELIVKNSRVQIFVAPKLGGGIFELDFLPKRLNLLDGMTRRPEPYHKKITGKRQNRFQLKRKVVLSIHDLLRSKEKRLDKLLVYDNYRRLSLLDHFFSQGVNCGDFKNSRYEELGNFINEKYSVEQERRKDGMSVILQRRGKVKSKNREMPLKISKKLSLNNKGARFDIEYTLENLGAEPIETIFGVEFNISPEGCEHPNRLRCNLNAKEAIYSLKDDVIAGGVLHVCLEDEVSGVKTVFDFDRKTDIWAHPLETISASEQGFERNYQQTVILPYWPLRLEKAWRVKIGIAVKEIPAA